MHVLPTPIHLLPRALPRAWPLIERAIEASPDDGWTQERLMTVLKQGQATLWLAVEGPNAHGVCVVEQSGSVARCVMLAGDRMREWLAPGLALIEEWARSVGCTAIETPGRKGWHRALRPLGYEQGRKVL